MRCRSGLVVGFADDSAGGPAVRRLLLLMVAKAVVGVGGFAARGYRPRRASGGPNPGSRTARGSLP